MNLPNEITYEDLERAMDEALVSVVSRIPDAPLRPSPADEDATISALHAKGLAPKQIAHEIRRTPDHVRRRLRRMGQDPDAWRVARNLEIVALWNGGGQGASAIGLKFKLEQHTIFAILKMMRDAGHRVTFHG